MRASAQVLIYVDVQKALDAGIAFSMSDNGVVLTEGNVQGYLPPEFFSRVEDRYGRPISGWEPISADCKVAEVQAQVDKLTMSSASSQGDAPPDGPKSLAQINSDVL
jgi:2'-phosphotransferase